jgi:hypothetical protein
VDFNRMGIKNRGRLHRKPRFETDYSAWGRREGRGKGWEGEWKEVVEEEQNDGGSLKTHKGPLLLSILSENSNPHPQRQFKFVTQFKQPNILHTIIIGPIRATCPTQKPVKQWSGSCLGVFGNPLCDLRSSPTSVGSLLSSGTCRGAECETDLPNHTASHSRRNSLRGTSYFRHTLTPSWWQSTQLQRHYLAGHRSVTLCISLGMG